MKFLATLTQTRVSTCEVESDGFSSASLIMSNPAKIADFVEVTSSSELRLDAVEFDNGPQPDRA